MNAVRMTITLPRDLAEELDTLVSSRKKSRFIAQSLIEKIDAVKKARLHKTLEEGYKARQAEGRSIALDFEAADLENWDEY
jgi:metal-responsive CopG/Arc/MetJ family transcriptional regulator